MKTYLEAYKINKNNKKHCFWAVEGLVHPSLDSGVFESFEFLRMRYSKCDPSHISITIHDTETKARDYLETKGVILNEIEKAHYWKPRK